MEIEGSISVGIGRVSDGPDRVTLVTNAGRMTLSAEFARHVAVQLMMAADFIEQQERSDVD